MLLIAASAPLHPAQGNKTMANAQTMAIEQVRLWIDQVGRVPDDQWRRIDHFSRFRSGARTESITWCEMVLDPSVNPHEPRVMAQHFYFVARDPAIDLLRHEIQTAAGARIGVFESANFVILRAPLQSAGPPAGRDVTALVERLIKTQGTDYRWEFRIPTNLADNTVVSSAPDVDPFVMASWKGRGDLLVRGGLLWFVVHKRTFGVTGHRPPHQWFEADIRRN